MSIRLLEGDCLEKMKLIPSGFVDMIATDLPYGTTACKWDCVIPFAPLWEQYKRIIKPKGAIILTATQPFTSALVMSNPKWFKYAWVWEKQKGTNFLWANKMPLKIHEDVCVFSNEMPTYFPQKTNPDRIALRSVKARGCRANIRDTAKVNKVSYVSDQTGRFPTTIQRFSNEGMNRGNHHPTQKPVALFEYLIKTYTNPGNLVLDNTMGSGTTGVACVNLKRSFIGIEMDHGYFEIAKKRITEAMTK